MPIWAALLTWRHWQSGWMTSRWGRSCTRMVTWGRAIPGKMGPVGRNVCVSPKSTSPCSSLPWAALSPFSGGTAGLLGVWKGFFLEPRGLLSPRWHSFPAWRKQQSLVLAPSCPALDWVVPTQSSKQCLILSYLCPNVWELHRSVYIGLRGA